MAKNGSVVEDMEEGEISDDSMSIEEISEEDFKREAEVVSKPKPKGDSRAWMGDLLNYSVSNYSPVLHNFAWAQAVQNKPLRKEFMVRDFGSDEKSKTHSPDHSLNTREDSNKGLISSNLVQTVVIDDSSEESDGRMEEVGGIEKEEGELEEGEIELDVGIVEKVEEGSKNDNLERNLNDSEFDKRILSIGEALKTITVKEAEKSFTGVCSQLWRFLESLELMLVENRVPAVEALIQQSFSGIQVLNSVFSSMTRTEKEQNKIGFKRLLDYVKSKGSDLFPPDYIKEIETMIHLLDFPCGISSVKAIDNKRELSVNNGVNLNALGTLSENPPVHSLNSLKKLDLKSISVKPGNQFEKNMGSETLKTGIWSGSRSSRGFGALFDLHKDHDADSLPSPTRETPPPLSVKKIQVVQDTIVKADMATSNVADKSEDANMQPYETDALKAVCTYQQKFGHTSFLSSNRLPSPTPSGDFDDGDGDSNPEVSSSPAASNGGIVYPPVPAQAAIPGPATPHMVSSNRQEPVAVKIAGQLTSDLRPVLRAPTKSRDPRLQFANREVVVRDVNNSSVSAPPSQPIGGMMSSRKHNIVEESVIEGRTLKRQRNGFTGSDVSREAQMVSHGWLENSFRKAGHGEVGSGERQFAVSEIHNVRTGGNEQLAVSATSNTVSLPSVMKDIAVNPTMLMHLIMEQQRLVATSQQKSGDSAQKAIYPSNPGVILGTVPLLNVASSKSSDTEQKPIGKPQITAQTLPMNPQAERGKIRMKPRDPRRILQNSTFQQNESSRPEQFRANGTHSSIIQASKDNGPVWQHGDQTKTTSLPSQSASPPDIARQFTKNLKNLADILSTNTCLAVTQPVSSQPIPAKMDKAELSVVAIDCNEQQSRNCLTPEEDAKGPSQPQNAWGEMEHLFEGYDDHQKAAIQRERARRIEEQNKMFAAKKLCLVLDLDHTLLNSAKFVEVDPGHEDILKMKEEQDRGKPQRHLFRFPHMGMWTKLRPGVWNFLEKASKLYELHLYTMGNKRYATEMAKVLDPTGALFAGRVISRGDDGESDGEERVPKIKDLDGVLGMESAVVIIDDSVRVWPHNRLNLIAVERYIYFPCSRRQFGLLGPSLLEIDHDERSEDGTLASSLAVIERIHRLFFSHQSLNDLDVRNILASEQRKILAGCRIVFSRVFPVGVAKPELHPLWQTAEQFGAVCTNQIDEQVTHVVANSPGTDKVNWALSTGRFVVHPGWYGIWNWSGGSVGSVVSEGK
ncbi:BRCT domain [Macleaya cordata]|uniref:protein-serine/threonine phosphatase n=1 Tax=Macleaya cordata TaxID=56857 RepID=A0A200QGN2_MACCD|nr:BRCT domain [Macleaya cordata]